MQNKKGSSILIVIAMVVLLAIVSISVMENRSKRAGFTRFMSNEKKAEAIAEAVLDSALSNIRSKANDHENQNNELYKLLRIAWTPESNGIANEIGNEVLLEEENFYPSVKSVFLNSDATFEIKEVKAKITHAEVFASHESDAKVVGINEAPQVNTTFKEISQANPKNNDNWKFRYMYPPTANSPSNEINNHYKNNQYTDGLYSDKDNSRFLTDPEYMGYHYATPKIDINISWKGLVAKIIKLFGNFPERTFARVLFKTGDKPKMSDSNSCFAFGIYMDKKIITAIEELHAFAKGLLDPPEDDSFWNKIRNGLADIAKKILSQGLTDDQKKALEDFIALPKIDNTTLNEMMQKVIKENGKLSEYLDENNLDVEYLLLNYLKTFEKAKNSMQRLTVKEFLRFLTNGQMGTDPTSWTTELNKYKNQNTFDERIVEKGGVLQLSCKVTYTPNGGSAIKKLFIAEIPFKLSDVQPVAPAYNFFLANTSDSVVDINKSDPSDSQMQTLPSDCIILHNGNHCGEEGANDRIHPYAKFDPQNPPAGKVRINGENIKPIYLYCGSAQPEIQYCELPALLLANTSETNNMPLQTKATFGFDVDSKAKKFNYKSINIAFPVLTTKETTPPGYTKAKNAGITSMIEMYKGGDLVDLYARPVLLFGFGHLDYPMGMQIEGKVGQTVSEMGAYITPNINLSLNLESENLIKTNAESWDSDFYVYYRVAQKNNYYPPKDQTAINSSAPNLESFNGAGKAEQSDPPYLYQFDQYKMKATRYYKNDSDFFADFDVKYEDGGFNDNGKIRLEGVIFVDGAIKFDGRKAFGNEYKFAGNSLVVSDVGITINKNIKLEEDSSLGIIARLLTIQDNTEVHAACCCDEVGATEDASIYGNFVINKFNRSSFSGVFNVRYEPRNIAVKGTNFYDVNDKINNKRRYYASFANNWSNSYYSKKTE